MPSTTLGAPLPVPVGFKWEGDPKRRNCDNRGPRPIKEQCHGRTRSVLHPVVQTGGGWSTSLCGRGSALSGISSVCNDLQESPCQWGLTLGDGRDRECFGVSIFLTCSIRVPLDPHLRLGCLGRPRTLPGVGYDTGDRPSVSSVPGTLYCESRTGTHSQPHPVTSFTPPSRGWSGVWYFHRWYVGQNRTGDSFDTGSHGRDLGPSEGVDQDEEGGEVFLGRGPTCVSRSLLYFYVAKLRR